MSEVQTTIQELNWYIKVKRREMTYFLYVTQETTSREIKRSLKEFVNRRIHQMQLTIPRYGDRVFRDTLTMEQVLLQNGETLVLQLQQQGSDTFESLDIAKEGAIGLPKSTTPPAPSTKEKK